MMSWHVEGDQKRCQECGSHVSPEFRRGYGDEDDVVHRCTNCDTRGRLAKGSGAGKDLVEVDPLENPHQYPLVFGGTAIADGGER